jgi:hypothetical protein
MITIDKLQLYRNGVYFESKELALQALENEKTNAKDGEIMLARYYTPSPYEMNEELTVYTIIAVFARKDDDVQMTICDPSEFHDKLNDVDINGVGGTLYDDNGYLSYSIVIAAKDIKTSQDYTVINHESVADVSFESILVGDDIETALTKLETNFERLINEIIDNELVVAKAITTLNEVIGLDSNGLYPEVVNGPLTGAKTMCDADTLLATEIEEAKERITVLEAIPPLQSSEFIILSNVYDDDNNIIARQLNLSDGINIIVESDYELD